MNVVGFVIKTPGGKFLGIDQNSGGYGYEVDTFSKSVEIYLTREDAQKNADFWNERPAYNLTGLTVHPLYLG